VSRDGGAKSWQPYYVDVDKIVKVKITIKYKVISRLQYMLYSIVYANEPR